jgi:uncharacterized protein
VPGEARGTRTSGPPVDPDARTPTPHSGRFAGFRWLPCVCVLALATGASLTEHAGLAAVTELILAGLVGLTALFAVLGRALDARLALCLAVIATAGAAPWLGGWWPIPGVIGLCAYFVAHARARCRPPATAARILRSGRFGLRDALYVLVLVLVSVVALLLFRAFTPAPVSSVAALLTAWTPHSLLVAGATFAMLNAFVEELLFRGVLMHHLGRVMSSWLAVGLQAVAFGLLHLNGYPYGPVGVGLAGIYAVLLGVLRLQTGGLLACWIAHVCADIVIFAVLVTGSS